jgi:phthalate 4,5-dioxygenase reductase component
MNSTVLVNPENLALRDEERGEEKFHKLRITRKEQVARDIYLFELRDAQGGELPPFTPGSHLTVEVPGGARRNYSLCSDPAERHFYEIAVKRDENGRGGSIGMADHVHAGELLSVSEPRNNFELNSRAKKLIFVAGGIGITPILSMMRHLRSAGAAAFSLYYLTRSAENTAFLEELEAEFPGKVKVHHDNGDRENVFDLWPVFERPVPSAHVYCCGPKPLMDSVKGMTGHWNAGTVHFESFGVDAKKNLENKPFVVRLQRSNESFEVGANQTILEALRAHGHRVPSSCESGTCGSCKIGLAAGEAEHRDAVLSEEEQTHHIMVCVSRAKSPELVLDL